MAQTIAYIRLKSLKVFPFFGNFGALFRRRESKMAEIQDSVCGFCLESFRVKDIVSEFCEVPHRYHFDCLHNGYASGAMNNAVAGNRIKCPHCRESRPLSDSVTLFVLEDRLAPAPAPATEFPDWEWWLPTMPPTPPTFPYNHVNLELEANLIPAEVIELGLELLFGTEEEEEEPLPEAPTVEENGAAAEGDGLIGLFRDPEFLDPKDIFLEPGVVGVILNEFPLAYSSDDQSDVEDFDVDDQSDG